MDVWWLKLSNPTPNVILSNQEMERASRFHFNIDRERFIGFRKLTKFILSKYLNVDANELNFHYEQNGKPYIARSDLQFNWSHSGNDLLIACSYYPLGADIEFVNHPREDIADVAFHKDEKYFLSKAKKPILASYVLWTRKEALLKADGQGLLVDLPSVSTVGSNGELLNTVSLSEKNWIITSLYINNYVVSIATARRLDMRFNLSECIDKCCFDSPRAAPSPY